MKRRACGRKARVVEHVARGARVYEAEQMAEGELFVGRVVSREEEVEFKTADDHTARTVSFQIS